MNANIKVAGHAVQGRGHATQNKVCQDKVLAIHFQDNHSAIVALADGAGSCSHAHLGAEFVVSVIGSLIHKRFENYFQTPEIAGSEILHSLQSGLKYLSYSRGAPLPSFSSTLLFVYVCMDKKNTRYLAGHIGDGVIAMKTQKGVCVLSQPENGEYANSTFFLTGPNAVDHFRICKGHVTDHAGFLLFSDGPAECLYIRAKKELAPASESILNWLSEYSERKISRLLKWNLRHVFKEMTCDDCSMALIGTGGMKRKYNSKKKEKNE